MAERFVEAGLRPAWGAARVGWHIRDADSVVLIARHGPAVAGFAIMRYGDERAHLNLLAVDPQHRRRGIARTLLTWLEESALTAGTFTVSLELRAHNGGARAFYGALGYTEAGEVRFTPGRGDDRAAAARRARAPRRGRAPGASGS
jgi:ribosomal-protein-alanine N-acetyltransferase